MDNNGGGTRVLIALGVCFVIVVLLLFQGIGGTGAVHQKSSIVAGPTNTTSSNVNPNPERMYNVTFYDASHPPGCYYTQWAVEMDNVNKTESIVAPSRASQTGGGSSGNASVPEGVTFSVPSGVYNFALYPTAWIRYASAPGSNFAAGPTGAVMVTNSDVTIDVLTGGICG